MKRLMCVVLGVVLVAGAYNNCFAADKAAAKKKAVEPAQPALSDAQRATLADQAIKKLTGQAWQIFLFPQSGPATFVETDTLTFTTGTLTAEGWKTKGFGTSNFTLTIRDDGTAIFETVQRDAKNDLALWRGELRGDGLNGVIGFRPVAGARMNYGFSTMKPELVSPAKAKLVSQPVVKKN